MEFEANGIVGGAIAKSEDIKPKYMITRIFIYYGVGMRTFYSLAVAEWTVSVSNGDKVPLFRHK